MLPQDTRKSLAQLEAEHNASMKNVQKPKKTIVVVDEGYETVVLPVKDKTITLIPGMIEIRIPA